MLIRLRLGAIREQLDGLLEEAARRQLNLREALAWLYENGRVTARETDDEGRTHVVVRLHPAALGRFERQFG
jgi:GTP-binding protein HflX